MIRKYILFLFIVCVGKANAQTVQTLLDTGLPLIEIQTVNRKRPTYTVADRPDGCLGWTITNQTKVPGRMTIKEGDSLLYDSGDYEEDLSGITIRVRGNQTASLPKKPYKLKLQEKADLLFRGDSKYEDKNWLLIKDEHYYAKVGFKVNELMGLQWTPAYKYVNVILNGDYIGVYMLTESVKRKGSRLDVSSDGYIFEYDIYWWNEDFYIKSPTPLPWSMHYTFKYPDPEDMTEDKQMYFTNLVKTLESSIMDGSYPDYLDVESFASWILGNDILGNMDGGGANYYLTKYDETENSKVMMGNLWDFDAIFEDLTTWSRCHHMFYFSYLFKSSNDKFVREYKGKWEALLPTVYDELYDYLDTFAASDEAKSLDISMKYNDAIWRGYHNPVQVQVTNIKNKLNSRRAWLTSAINGLKVNIDEIKTDSSESKEYYNLQGQRIVNPQQGLYIRNGRKYIFH